MISTAVILVLLLTASCTSAATISIGNYRPILRSQSQASDFCGKTPMTIHADFNTNCAQFQLPNCGPAWNGFSGAFSGKPPATVTATDYNPYFNELPIQAGQNQSLFWSGTYAIVQNVSQPNPAGAVVVSSANTPSGVIVNNLGNINWCGNTTGIDYANDCLCNVTTQFWVQFSALFARAAKGSTFFLGDGERVNGTFSNTSFFSTVELPNMTAGVVKEVVALVVHRKGKGESCADKTGNSSIITLRNRVHARGFLFDCYDIYGQVSNPNQTNTISGCVATVIRGVQIGMRPPDHQVHCVFSLVTVVPSGGETILSSFGVMIVFAVLTNFVVIV